MHAIRARAGRWASRALLALGAVVFLVLVVGPQTGRYRTLTVLTASMRPTYPAGSIVLVTPTPISELRVGDVITYAIPVEDHRVVTHRIVEIVEPGVVRTKGDANNAPDTWVARLNGSTVWKARVGLPGVGQAIQVARHPAIRLVSLLASIGSLTVVGLRRIWLSPSHA